MLLKMLRGENLRYSESQFRGVRALILAGIYQGTGLFGYRVE